MPVNVTFPYGIDVYPTITNYVNDAYPGSTLDADSMNRMLASASVISKELINLPTSHSGTDMKLAAVTFYISNLRPVSNSGANQYICTIPASIVSFLGSAAFTLSSGMVALVDARPAPADLSSWDTAVSPSQCITYRWGTGADSTNLYVGWYPPEEYPSTTAGGFYISVILTTT